MKYNTNQSDNLLTKIIISSIVAFVLIIFWDLLTSNPVLDLTINPLAVDWQSCSWRNIDVNSFIQTLLSALLGFIFTIIFIERILKRSRDKEIQEKRDLQFENISKVIKAPLFEYHKAALSVSTPITDLDRTDKIQTPIDIRVFAEIYLPQLYVDEPLTESKIELYSRAFENLKQMIMNILLNVDLSENKELSDILSDYLIKVSSNNSCRQIIGYKKMTAGKEKMTDLVIKMLKTTNIVEMKPGTICYPFVKLKELIEFHEDFLSRLYKISPWFFVDKE